MKLLLVACLALSSLLSLCAGPSDPSAATPVTGNNPIVVCISIDTPLPSDSADSPLVIYVSDNSTYGSGSEPLRISVDSTWANSTSGGRPVLLSVGNGTTIADSSDDIAVICFSVNPPQPADGGRPSSVTVSNNSTVVDGANGTAGHHHGS